MRNFRYHHDGSSARLQPICFFFGATTTFTPSLLLQWHRRSKSALIMDDARKGSSSTNERIERTHLNLAPRLAWQTCSKDARRSPWGTHERSEFSWFAAVHTLTCATRNFLGFFNCRAVAVRHALTCAAQLIVGIFNWTVDTLTIFSRALLLKCKAFFHATWVKA